MLQMIVNAEIRTMNPALARAEAAVIRDGRFAFVGSLEGAKQWLGGKPCRKIDAQGNTVIPGLNDSHMHYLHTATCERNVNLSGARSRAEAVARLRAGLSARAGQWLVGESWNQEDFDDRKLLTREDLDQVSLDVPILASRACGHIVAVNSAAMRIAGIDVADGILREDEQDAVRVHIPTPDDETLLSLMEALQPKLFSQGITSIQSDDMCSVPAGRAPAFLRALRDVSEAGRLKMRYAQQAQPCAFGGVEGLFEGLHHQVAGKRFHVSCMKLLSDGSLGARTAWMRRPYADAPDTLGIGLYTDEEIGGMVRAAAEHGLPSAVHVIGDAAMEQALNAFEAHGKGLRHALVHAQIATAEQNARIGRLGLTVMAQPIFLAADAPIVAQRIGHALAHTSYRWRSMQGGGARVTLGTDCPVEPFDTMPNLYCAVTRKGLPGYDPYLPDEAFSLEEALYAYTAAGAYASGEENEKGRIQAGMAADFVVLDCRLSENEPASLLEAGIEGTYIDGECVYSS